VLFGVASDRTVNRYEPRDASAGKTGARARAACRRRVMPEDLVRLSTAHFADSVAQPLQPSGGLFGHLTGEKSGCFR